MARPNLSYLKNVILIVVGVPCGVLTGLTGMTNSYIVTPLLNWLAGVKSVRLIGSTLAVSSFSALTGILAYAQLNCVEPGMTIGVALGFLAGAAYAQRAGAGRPGGAALGRAIGSGAATALALLMILNAHGLIRFHVLAGAAFHSPWWFASAIILGAVAGIAGRVLDLAGFLIAPGMYYIAGSSMIAAQGSAVAILLVNSIPATFAYARRGFTEPRTAVWVSVGALFGALGGSRAAALHSHDRDMLMVYAIVLLIMVVVRVLSSGAPEQREPAKQD